MVTSPALQGQPLVAVQLPEEEDAEASTAHYVLALGTPDSAEGVPAAELEVIRQASILPAKRRLHCRVLQHPALHA
jgi:hypothetical protein